MKHKEWTNILKGILKKIDVTHIKQLNVYIEAFTHKSFANENNLNYSQQRLEFLGDSAISWVISNYLYSIKPKISEGEMTIAKSKLVDTKALAKAATEIGIDKLLLLGKGASNNKLTDKILEDTFEAFVGAVAQDQGIKKVIKLLDITLISYHKNNLIQFKKDYKTQFQEIVQSTCSDAQNRIRYEKLVDKKNVKISRLYFNDILYGVGKGSNYKDAEQEAARRALSKCQNPNK